MSIVLTVASPDNTAKTVVLVNKCCEEDEIMVDNHCTHLNETNVSAWSPVFTSEDGKGNIPVNFKLIIGDPNCGSTQQWTVLHYQNSLDQLQLLPSGILRHYAHQEVPKDNDYDIESAEMKHGILFYDYKPGEYCLDKVILFVKIYEP